MHTVSSISHVLEEESGSENCFYGGSLFLFDRSGKPQRAIPLHYLTASLALQPQSPKHPISVQRYFPRDLQSLADCILNVWKWNSPRWFNTHNAVISSIIFLYVMLPALHPKKNLKEKKTQMLLHIVSILFNKLKNGISDQILTKSSNHLIPASTSRHVDLSPSVYCCEHKQTPVHWNTENRQLCLIPV